VVTKTRCLALSSAVNFILPGPEYCVLSLTIFHDLGDLWDRMPNLMVNARSYTNNLERYEGPDTALHLCAHLGSESKARQGTYRFRFQNRDEEQATRVRGGHIEKNQARYC
jgi:hypothetical protein